MTLPRTAKKITLLGTRPTVESGLYQKGLQEAGLPCVLKPAWQDKIDAILLSIKSSASLGEAARLREDLCRDFLAAEIDTLLLACTDLNVLMKTRQPPFTIVDSAACLAEAIVRKWENLKKTSL